MNNLNANINAPYFQLTRLQLANVSSPALVANFEYDGVSTSTLPGYSDAFTETVVTSQYGSFDKLLTAYTIDTGKTLARSPYTIGGRCVTHVIEFTGNRAISLGLGAYIPTSLNHRYILYGLEGSDLSLEKVGNVYTFKSDPSDFSWSADSLPLPSGDYTLDAPVFGGASNSIVFNNVVPLSNPTEYSCSQGNDDVSVAPYWVTGLNLMQGLSYVSSVAVSGALVNVPFTAPTEIAPGVMGHASTSPGSPRGFNIPLKLGFSKINCTYSLAVTLSYDIGCPAWLSNLDIHSQVLPYDKYKYMWVFSTMPIREFYHQQSIATTTTDIFDLQLHPTEKTGSLGTYNAGIVEGQQTIYASRINLEKCKQIFAVSHYSNLAGQLFDAPAKVCDEVTNINLLNGFFANTHVGDGATTTPNAIRYFGIYFTSGNIDFTKFNVSNFKQYIKNTVSNPKDVELVVNKTDYPDDTVPYYVATSTIPGYYDPPVYVATTTNTATGGTITTNGLYTVHKFTSSGSFVPAQNLLLNDLLLLGGGGAGGNVYGGGGGGAGGYVSSSSVSVLAQPYTVTVGAGGSSASANGQNSTFSTFTAIGGGGGSGNSNGNTGGSGGGAGYSSYTGGSATSGQGYAGGNSAGGGGANAYGQGGGGGAGAVGQAGTTSKGGNGGAGISNSITGTAVTYGGGGGGGAMNGNANGTGGAGGGGDAGVSGTANTGGGGGGGVYNGSANGNGGSGVVIISYLTTTPGYYAPAVYHATTTVPGYWTNSYASSTEGYINSATGDDVNGIIQFSNESFSTNYAVTLGYSPILSGLDTNINSMYSYKDCVDSSKYGLFGYVMCAFISGGMKVFTILIIPSSNSLKTFQEMMNQRIRSGSSLFSTMMSIPLRTSNYGNLLWSPATTTKLTLGLNSSQKVEFLPPNIPTVGSTRYNVDKTLYLWIYPFLQVILLMFAGLWFLRIFRS